MAILSAGFVACGEDDGPEYEPPTDEQLPFTGPSLNGVWMQVAYTELGSEDGGDDRYEYLNAYSYRFVKFTFNENDNWVTAEWINYPQMTLNKTYYFQLKDNKLYSGEILKGTIVGYGKNSGETELKILWETHALPFNITPDHRNEAIYWLDNFSGYE